MSEYGSLFFRVSVSKFDRFFLVFSSFSNTSSHNLQGKQMALGDKMDLASYLLKPVQRMGKYALLLQQLMKVTRSDVTDLQEAEAMVRFQLRHGNDLLAMDSLRECDVSYEYKCEIVSRVFYDRRRQFKYFGVII